MTVESAREAGFQSYADFIVAVEPGTVRRIREFGTPDMHFRDPFNDVRGIDRVVQVFDKMFTDASEVRFEIVDRMRREERGLLLWRFWCRPNSVFVRERWQIDGVTEVILAPDGRVREHLDHWDASGQVYERLPAIGTMLRLLKRRLQIG